jgi:type I restriction enzyme S subunit
MKTVALGKVAKIDRTVANDDECLSLPYVGLEHVEKESGHFADDFVPMPLNMLATNFRFTPKHVLYGKLRPYLNKVVLPNFDGVCTTEILPILPNEEKLDRAFLWSVLLSPAFVSWATSQISGANLPRLNPKLLVEYEIPLPPLTEQKRIASLLRRADRLRQLRRTGHDLGDALLQSVFLEMFGDPGINPKKWDILPIEDLLSKTRNGLQTGPFGSSLKRHEYVLEGIPVWGINNLGENRFIEDKPLYITAEKFKQMKNYTVENGDIFISRAGTVGRMCVAYPSVSPSIIGTNLVRISLDFSIMNPQYFTALFSYFSSRFASLKMTDDENAYSFINPSILRSIRIPVPPLSPQEEFAGVVRRVEGLRGRMSEAERQVEGLFESLLAESFGGV